MKTLIVLVSMGLLSWIVIVLVSMGLLSWIARDFSAEKPLTDTEIDQLLQRVVEKQKRSPGIVVGIIDKDGKKIFTHGKFDADSTNNLDGDTVLEIGSISKAFTGILLAQAVLRGDLNLDDPAQKYLPTSVKLPTRDGKQVTLAHLATHTSGLPRMPDNLKPAHPGNPYADYTVEQLYAFLSNCKLSRVPGERYEYSNLAMGLLGHILALKAGTNYEALVRRDLCEPLEMRDTRITLTPDLKARLAPPHNSAGVRVENWDIPTLAGAGALRSTANDMLKLLAANMGLTQPEMQAAFERSHQPRHNTVKAATEVGLGWHIRTGFGTSYVWHNGATGGYHAFAGFDKKSQRGVVVLANAAVDIDDIGWHILEPRFEVAPFTRRQATKIDYKVYDEYVGRYKFPIRGEFVITRDGDHLSAKLDAQPALEVFPESPTNFFTTEVDAQLTFVKDSKGTVTHLILHQNGLDQKAKRVK